VATVHFAGRTWYFLWSFRGELWLLNVQGLPWLSPQAALFLILI
jgi:hypothetical protein